MSKHTQGPWYIRKTGPHRNNSQLTNIEICYGKDDECVADTVYRESDAHLIAAAPDLLEALEIIHGYWDRDYNSFKMVETLWFIVETAEHAIAKAKVAG